MLRVDRMRGENKESTEGERDKGAMGSVLEKVAV